MSKYEVTVNDTELNIKALSIQHSIINSLLPIISNNDEGHGWTHSVEVSQLAVDMNMRYNIYPYVLDIVTAGLLHDIGIIAGRTNHHFVGGLMLKEGHYKKWFNNLSSCFDLNKANIIAAIEEHRASFKVSFSSPLSRLISIADRGEPDITKKVKRLKAIGRDIQFVVRHIKEKYSSSGYIKYDPLYIEYFGDRFDKFIEDCEDVDSIVRIFKTC